MILSIIPSVLKSLSIAALGVLLASCGGGGSGSSSTGSVVSASNTGSVGILLTDKPTSLDIFSGIMITVSKVELFNADSGEKVTAYSGAPRGPYNLLRLRNASKPLTLHDSVPTGRYCKIRLTLDDLWLSFKDGRPDYHPKLPGNNKLDMSARDCFYVSADKIIYVQLDMDMSKSVHVVKRGKRDEYNIRPVVFINAVGGDFTGKLVRLEGGTVEQINRAEGTVLVCDALPIYDNGGRDRRDRCVKVYIGKDTSAFDNDSNDGNATSGGNAIPLADVFSPERVGRGPVTLAGYFRLNAGGVYAADHRNDSDSDDSDGGRGDADFDDSENNGFDDGHYLGFDALVIGFGEFLNLDGEVTSTSGSAEVNEALDATPTVSSTSATNPDRQFQANDGIVEDGNGWVGVEDVATETAWIRLTFDSSKDIHRVVLFDVVDTVAQLESGNIEFSDGSTIPITAPLPDDGTPVVFDFATKQTDWVQVNLTQAKGRFGLAEIEAYSSVASDDGFDMTVLPGQGYTSTDPLPVVLQPAPVGGNGTKILSRSGVPLQSDDIEPGLTVTVDGVLTGPGPVYLNSALVIVDTDALSKDIASGTIDRVGSNTLLLEADSFVCEPGTGPGFYVVNLTADTDVYQVTESSSGIEGDFVGSDSLEIGQISDISGKCVNNELLADTIVILP